MNSPSTGLKNFVARHENLLFGGFVLAVGVISVTLGILYPSPTQDSICRYAPMAEKFAVGDWFEAFHPRFGVLFPILSGTLVRLTGLDGMTACCAAAMVGWALALIPFFRLARNVFGSGVAWFAVILAALCPKTIFWAFQGLRETWRLLGFLLVASAFFEPRDRARTVAFADLLIGTAILLTLRVDTFLFAVVAWFAYAFYDLCRWRFFVLTAWCILWIQPFCYLTWSWTGWWLPSLQLTGEVIKYLGV